MNLNFLLKNADNKDIKINILKSWLDAFNNLIIVMEIKGKKYSVHKSSPAAGEEWSYFYGVGSSKKTSDMPAGRGDYLLGPKVGPISAKKISEVVKDSNLSSEFIQNKGGVSWSPKNKEEKEGLAKLVGMGGKINAYLSSSGINYTGGDKLLFGEDITPDDILAVPAKESAPPTQTPKPAPKPAPATTSRAKGNTPEVEAFIKFLSQSYSRKFGREIKITSTFRNSVEQAWAMRYPLASGDYDRLYGHLGPAADRIKDLISAKRYEEAAKIIETTSLVNGSHMAGRAIDVGFGSNGLRTSDYNKFSAVVQDASKESGIPARLNFEKSSHFHINVG